MNLNLRILLIIGSINIYSNDLISSINNLILNDLEFVQQTNINSRIDESVGKIYRKNNFIQVEILKPSKEKYIIKDSLIEVHDFDFNQIFARQVEALGRTDDHLVVISTSGNSGNISAAVMAAKNIGNMRITALTGRDGGALKAFLGREDVELRVPSESTARIQEAHAIIIHVLCTLVDNHFA